MDLLEQMLKDVAEDMQYILDNLSEEIASHPNKEELYKNIRTIDFATFVLSNEIYPQNEEEQSVSE